jgi:hypothetical protein
MRSSMRLRAYSIRKAGSIGTTRLIFYRFHPSRAVIWSMGFEPRIEILPPAQKKFWSEQTGIPPSFVLYGGTAVALRLGHRSSEDFDFFSSDSFETAALLAALPFSRDAEVLQSGKYTLAMRVERGGPVKLSFFGGLTFGRVGTPDVVRPQSFPIASLPDLMAAKLKVLWQRAEAKDYLDLGAFLNAGICLEHGLGCAVALYGEQFNPMIVLKALTYFEDGDLPTLPPEIRRLLTDAAANVRKIPEVRVASSRLTDH